MPMSPFSIRWLVALVIAIAPVGLALAGPYSDHFKKTDTKPALDKAYELSGPDTDQNGIRDDLDQWLTKAYPDAAERQAMQRAAAALQATLTVDFHDLVAVRAVADRNSQAVQCLWMFPASPRLALPGRALTELEGLTMNTPKRMAYYQLFAQLIGSQLPRAPMVCDPPADQSSR